MRYLPIPASLVILLLVLGLSAPVYSQDSFEISEFLAANQTGLNDEDRDNSDWIEIHNVGPGAANLNGWYLTDDRAQLTKWKFPAVVLEADAYLVVFASGKDRRDPAGKLHTNFRLSAAGEYLGLVRPDGVTVVSEYAPAFPIQAPDVSYGISGAMTEKVLLARGAPAKALVPRDGALEVPAGSDALRTWTLDGLDDSGWLSGVTGVGYGYPTWTGLDVSAMRNVNQTVYVRVPFVVQDVSEIRGLTLHIRFDDGMIAYINGHEVARDNAPALGAETWNSGAPNAWPTDRSAPAKDFSLYGFDFLHVGTNVLAVQGLNNGANSTDLLVLPELLAAVADKTPKLRYFPTPSPGKSNDIGVEIVGPIIADANHSPALPATREDLIITARISPSFAPVASVQLRYRVMFGAEMTMALVDDGSNGDEKAGDGVYRATIPRGLAGVGQMVRWYITAADTAGRESRFPTSLDPLNSPQYDGTVVADPSQKNALPVLHWFIQTPGSSDTTAGTRCSLFYEGEFYDNVVMNLHGQSSRGFPKKSYNIGFNPGHHFKWAQGQRRVGDINLMTPYPDKAQMRNMLAYETYRDAGCAYHYVFPVRVQQNGAFWGTAHVMENGDKDWLIRMGLNAEGALYKMYSTFTVDTHATSASSAEKKTRKNEGNTDLLALFNGISLSGDALRQYLYDNVDVAQVVDFLAARILTGDVDCCHKNYYFYRDTDRSNEWQMWPWDVDLSFGRVWNSSQTYWDQTLHANTSLFIGNNNRMPQAIFNTPETRQMYLRRVRTLMDELLKATPMGTGAPAPAPVPPPTPRPVRAAAADAEPGHYEPRIDELLAQIAPDAALDNAKWNSNAWGNGSTAASYPQSYADAVKELRDWYLPERRRQLFNRLSSGTGELPDAQPAGTVVMFGAIEGTLPGGNPDEAYIQLLNPNSFPVDISGWILRLGPNPPTPIFTFRGGTVIPAGGTLYVAANRPGFRARRRSPTGGQALFIVGDLTGQVPARGASLSLADRQGLTVASTSR